MTVQKDKIAVLKERAAVLKAPKDAEKVSGTQMVGLEFILGEESYAIDSTYVTEVVRIKELTLLPCTPAFVIGIINVKGKILAVIDIKKFFGLPDTGISNLNRVIVVKHHDIELGILADEISGNINIETDRLQTKITTISEVDENFIIGVSKERLIVLDIEALLVSEKIIINEDVV